MDSGMLTSSIEYLKALREGKYLQFLEWPQFLAQHYSNKDEDIDADETLNLIIFEWLNNGFCEEDAKRMALLTVVHDLESRPIRANLSYVFVSLSIAVFHCMIYQSKNVQQYYLVNEKLTRNEVSQLMKKQSIHLSESAFLEQEQIEKDKFNSWIETIDGSLVTEAFNHIDSITKFRYLTDDYITALETPIPNDVLRTSRISVLKSLAKYLNEQTEYTQAVKEEMELYVKQLWAMQPAEFEEHYLKEISPLSFADNALKFVIDYGLKFFSIIQPSAPLAINDKASSQPTQNS